jgi:glyoxylate reductase
MIPPQDLDSANRADFLAGLAPKGKYTGIVGLCRHNNSTPFIDVFDEEIVAALAPSVKWIAHNGAGYDEIDVAACQKKGARSALIQLIVCHWGR